ncbi:N-acetyl-1-D-myo-inositol-2-amino-2-deoxy-alpha-D-glucopyranoside deacetylase [Streptomyces meridianus]|uniref:1D-myo-inositol 2-acetamido-2-deoxy-alpha-D-glucopyranoside deacetylase n=1 Tax=Streptomyces meridianus TaxID=2938945 RepID=A0ABT0X315_9ACTN|nr:N-acetyl-1-D-myo-inositol-2-amino-2-deoxy-alpha-D-glucopyranoside deacetylase [Streptomyces meridianus]MCM2576214.1 N-acetyl-1-D-myo-inositol-2-amino-2-deoxy-alpha-D-glucopyranoside deacetylase [Streptomyces meridianus]
MTDQPSRRRLLLVHAHPDDETINNGATMAKYAAEGAHVTLVTCTLGEEGEVIPPALARLAADREGGLGEYRIGELAAAMRELGVDDHRFLGGAGRYRDSGMMGVEQNTRPECFWQAEVDEAAALLVEIVREVRPQVMVTYDPNGGYGHPDHIQAHRVAMRAAELAAEPVYRRDLGDPHAIDKIYWNCLPRGVVAEGLEQLREAGTASVPSLDDLPGLVDDKDVTAAIDGSAFRDAKAAAMRAHATQITVDGPFFALSNGMSMPIVAHEFYRLVHGEPREDVPENDLFAGIAAAEGGTRQDAAS